jgi:chromosome partitioning protein
MILALINNKGGVGKTTTAVNLAAALTREGESVLLIDLDSQGAASLSCGLRRAELNPSIADVLFGKAEIGDVIRHTAIPKLDLLPGSIDLAESDLQIAHGGRGDHTLVAALDSVRAQYDSILMDCPPSLSALSANALVAADQYIVPVMPHYLALGGLASLLDAVNRMSDQAGGDVAELMGFVLTFVDYRNRATTKLIETLRENWKDNVFDTEIRVNIKLAEAPSHGQSIFEYAPTSTGARSYKQLAREARQRHKVWTDSPAPSPAIMPPPPQDQKSAIV